MMILKYKGLLQLVANCRLDAIFINLNDLQHFNYVRVWLSHEGL